MTGRNKLKPIRNNSTIPFINKGPLLKDISSESDNSLQEYIESGGLKVFKNLLSKSNARKIIRELEKSKLRGRAGGGYPLAHKWWLVRNSKSKEKYFICNANSGSPGGFKEKYLINLNPYRVIEAVAAGALVVGAETGIIAIPPLLSDEANILNKVIQELERNKFLGSNVLGSGKNIKISVFETPGEYITGEETALLELLQGKIGQPRGKPSLPTEKGLFGKPSCVNNLETVLQAHYILKEGVSNFQRSGIPNAFGTVIVCLSGNVKRPGIYEIPLGLQLKELIYDLGQGVENNLPLLGVLPGGISSPILLENEIETGMDYDSLREAGSDMGSGSVLVISNEFNAVDISKNLSTFFHEVSCGKCLPCKQGTDRTTVMLKNLGNLDKKSIDRMYESLPDTKRVRSLNVIQPMGGISYTDTVEVSDKIPHLCEFYKYRGDCRHSFEAASSIQSLFYKFRNEFETEIS